ncbi:hypothetical protein [Dyadobacter frigoris]|nr:hypothetical protein [Dyadobacter frigoris]
MKPTVKSQETPFKKFTISRLEKAKGAATQKPRETTMTTSGTTCTQGW